MLTGRSSKSKSSASASSVASTVATVLSAGSHAVGSEHVSSAGTVASGVVAKGGSARGGDEEAIQKVRRSRAPLSQRVPSPTKPIPSPSSPYHSRQVIATAKKRREDMHVVRLCEAAAKGDLEKMQRMLSNNRIDVNRGDYDKRRPLHLAACEGHLKVIELLIVSQADVNVKDRFDGTPLADALRHRKLAAAQLLHRHGAFRDTLGLAEHLCFCAADEGRLEELRFLTAFQTEFAPDNFDSRTALHIAASVGNAKAVRLLIGARADVNVSDRRGRTPLQESYRHRHEDCSRLLMEHGAHMGAFDAALHMCYAAAADDLETLSRLIRHGCAVNAADYDKRTPLHLAASNARVAACTLLLEQPNIDVAAEDRFGNTAHDDALRETADDQPIVRALLRARGVPTGSHAMDTPIAIVHAEEVKAEVEARQTDVQREVAGEAQRFHAWVKGQKAFVARMAKATDAALKLELEQGEVLTDATPKYWHELQAFAERHPQAVAVVRAEMAPALASWSARANENRFDISMADVLERRVRRTARARARRALGPQHLTRATASLYPPRASPRAGAQVSHLAELQSAVAKNLERLVEAQFTAHSGEAEKNAASNARRADVKVLSALQAAAADAAPTPARKHSGSVDRASPARR